jgi:hypothetical protein
MLHVVGAQRTVEHTAHEDILIQLYPAVTPAGLSDSQM